MKLLFVLYTALIFLYSCVSFKIRNHYKNLALFNLKNHLQMVMKMREKTRNLLQNLYVSANRVERFSKYQRVSRTSDYNDLLEDEDPSVTSESADLGSRHTNKYNNPKNYRQYKYLTHNEIVKKLENLAQQHPDYIKLDTAQNLYGLPYPGGNCGMDENNK